MALIRIYPPPEPPRGPRSSATVRSSFLRGYVELARSVGLDPLRMLDAAGIPREALTDPELRVPTIASRVLLESSARVAEDFGLRLSEMRTPSIMGPLALVVRDQTTLRNMLVAFARYVGLHSDANVMRLEEAGDIAILRVELEYPSPGPHRQSTELSMGQTMQVLRRHMGPQWRPLSVSLIHGPPASLAAYRRVFRAEVRFNQDFDGFVFPRLDLDCINPASDPELAQHIERYADELTGSTRASLPDKARRFVLDRLSTGNCTQETLALQLGVELRTLQRQFAAAGTTFGQIVQEVRMELTIQYLDGSDRSLAEVAELLGFSALSAFSRWHHAHYGQTLSARRARRTHAP